jgi:hypothetical protein
MWIYNFSSSLWVEILPAEGSPVPEPRTDMVFLLLGDVIFLQGTVVIVSLALWRFSNFSLIRWLRRQLHL